MNFWAFLFFLMVFAWIGINSNTKAGKLARLLILRIIERLLGRRETKPPIAEKKPDPEPTIPSRSGEWSRGKVSVSSEES